MYSPKFVISNKVLKNIGQVEASKEVIENAPLVPSFEKQFQTDAIAKTIHHGTHIEGNELNLVQTKKILEGQEVYGRPRDIQEVVNYRNVMTLLDELSFKRGDYDVTILTDIHKTTVEKIVSAEKVGVLRTTQVVIKEEGTGKIVLKPPAFVEVPYLLEDFFNWLNSDEAKEIHPILRAAIVHYVLVAIHPFVEGNGRTVRAFTQLVLMREGYDIKRFFSLEENFDSDLASYYDALFKVDKESASIVQRDLTPWLEYFTEVVALELSKIKEKVRKLSLDVRMKTKFGEQIALTERQMRLMEYISDQGSVPMLDLKKLIPMVSEDTILRDLNSLLKKGIIKKEGSTKSSRYVFARG
ncbi:MAG: Fic family protein [Candidatus Woesebacteria bacterium]|nr:Fic family protein [Candidatus Woesebacteria bacterium]